MIKAIDDFCKIDTTDEPKRLVAVSTIVKHADITAAATNGGTVYIGGPTVSSYADDLKGTPLATDDIRTLTNTDLYDWWIVGTAGDYVFWGGEIEQ